MLLSKQDKNIVMVYLITLIIAAILVVIIINFNGWFFSDDQAPESQYTPVTRNTIGTDEFNSDVFQRDTFRSLGPLLTDEELKQLESTSGGGSGSGGSGGTITPTVHPKREVRRGNPFIPF